MNRDKLITILKYILIFGLIITVLYYLVMPFTGESTFIIRVLYYLVMPFTGESTFIVTVLYYVVLFITPLAIFKYFKIKLNNALLLYMSVVFALFLSETLLRFYFKYPLTYSEKQWEKYQSLYESYYFSEGKNGHLHIRVKDGIYKHETPEFNFGDERTNRFGLRGKLPAKNKKTILALGDSFTESAGAPSDSSYPVILGKYIAQSDTNIEVINGGVSGSDPFFEFMLLKEIKKDIPIHSALFMVNTTDINDVMVRGGLERFLEDGRTQFRKAPYWEPLYTISYVFRLIMHKIGYNYMLMTRKEELVEKNEAIKRLKGLFEYSIIPWAKKENIKLYLVLQPMIGDILYDYDEYVALNKEFSELDITYFNLLDSLSKCDKLEQLYWPQDGHFNSKGYSEIARNIYHSFFKDKL